MRINIFVVNNQTNNLKAKIHAHKPTLLLKKFHSYIKIFSPFKYKQKFCFLLNMRMINLSLYELRQITKGRNISDYENKSEEDFKKSNY